MNQYILLKLIILLPALCTDQQKHPHQISTFVYSVKHVGDKYEADALLFFYNTYYNKDGTQRTAYEFDIDPIPEKVLYDSSGNIIKRIRLGRDGSFSYGNSYVYDSLNRIQEQSIIDEYDNIISRTEFDYDKHGKKTRAESFENDSISIRKTLFEYASKANQNKQNCIQNIIKHIPIQVNDLSGAFVKNWF